MNSNLPQLVVTSEQTAEEAKDYIEFLEKAKMEAEKREKERVKRINRAKETNMSPWASRM